MYLKSTCLKGLEPPTYWFVASHSIQLSYRHICSTNNIIAQKIWFVKGFFKFFRIRNAKKEIDRNSACLYKIFFIFYFSLR